MRDAIKKMWEMEALMYNNTHSVDLVRAAHQGMKRAWREEFDPVMNPKRRHTSVNAGSDD